jgi:hypothetical protein
MHGSMPYYSVNEIQNGFYPGGTGTQFGPRFVIIFISDIMRIRRQYAEVLLC